MVLGAVARPDGEVEKGLGAGGSGGRGEGVGSRSRAGGGDEAEGLSTADGLPAEVGIAEANGVGFDVAGVTEGHHGFVAVGGRAGHRYVGGANVDAAGVGRVDVPDGWIPDVEVDSVPEDGDIEVVLFAAAFFPATVSDPRDAEVEGEMIFVDSGGGFGFAIPEPEFAEVSA